MMFVSMDVVYINLQSPFSMVKSGSFTHLYRFRSGYQSSAFKFSLGSRLITFSLNSSSFFSIFLILRSSKYASSSVYRKNRNPRKLPVAIPTVSYNSNNHGLYTIIIIQINKILLIKLYNEENQLPHNLFSSLAQKHHLSLHSKLDIVLYLWTLWHNPSYTRKSRLSSFHASTKHQ